MSSQSVDSFATMLAGMAAGSLQGKQMAQQENDADQQRQQQMGMQLIPTLIGAQQRAREQQLAPFEAAQHAVPFMSDADKAAFYTRYTNASAQPGPPVDWGGLSTTFPADSPLRGLIAGMGGPAASPAGGSPSGAPSAPGPTPGVVPTIPGAPVVAAGGVTAPPAGAPGGAGPAAPPQIQTPFGSFGIGPDPKQLAAVGAEVSRIAPRFGGQNLSPEFRQQAGALVQRATQQVQNRDLAGAQQTIAELRSLETQIPEKERAGSAGAARGLEGDYQRRLGQFRTKTSSGGGAYADINELSGMEKKAQEFAKAHPEVPFSPGQALSDYEPQITEMQGQFAESKALRGRLGSMTPADRTKAEKRIGELDKQWQRTANSLHDMLHFELPPSQRTAGIGQVFAAMGKLAPDQRTPENVASMLEANGNPKIAAVVRARGLNFGGADAERQTEGLLKSLPSIMRPGTSDAVRKAFADRIDIASKLTGHAIGLTAEDLKRPDSKDIKNTAAYRAAQDAHDKAALEIARLRAQNQVGIGEGGGWTEAALNLDLKRARRDQAMGLYDPALDRSVLIGRIRELQHTADKQYTNYHTWLTSQLNSKDSTLDPKFDPGYWLKQPDDWKKAHPLDDTAATGVGLYQQWLNADNQVQSKLGGAVAEQRKAAAARQQELKGGTAGAGQAKVTAAERTGGDRSTPRQVTIGDKQISTSPASYYEYLQRGVQAGRMTAQQANAQFRSVFGAR